MKNLFLFLISLFAAISSFGQATNTQTIGSSSTIFKSKGWGTNDSGFVLTNVDTSVGRTINWYNGATGRGSGLIFYNGSPYYRSGDQWIRVANGSDAGVSSFNSRTGAVIPLVGDYSSFYGQLASSNTWSSTNNFTTRPTYNSSGLIAYSDSGRGVSNWVTGGSLNKVRDSLAALSNAKTLQNVTDNGNTTTHRIAMLSSDTTLAQLYIGDYGTQPQDTISFERYKIKDKGGYPSVAPRKPIHVIDFSSIGGAITSKHGNWVNGIGYSPSINLPTSDTGDVVKFDGYNYQEGVGYINSEPQFGTNWEIRYHQGGATVPASERHEIFLPANNRYSKGVHTMSGRVRTGYYTHDGTTIQEAFQVTSFEVRDTSGYQAFVFTPKGANGRSTLAMDSAQLTFADSGYYVLNQFNQNVIGVVDGGVALNAGSVVIRSGGAIVPTSGGSISLGASNRRNVGGIANYYGSFDAETFNGADVTKTIGMGVATSLGGFFIRDLAVGNPQFTINQSAPAYSFSIGSDGSVGVNNQNGGTYKLYVVGQKNTIGIAAVSQDAAGGQGLFISGSPSTFMYGINESITAPSGMLNQFRNASTASGANSYTETSTAATSGSAAAYNRFYTTASDWSLGTRRDNTSFDIVKGASLTTTTPALSINYSTENVTIKNSLLLSSTPTTSAGTYDFLTRNTSTGVVEKVTSIPNSMLANSSISFATGTTGTDVNWSGSPTSLGGTATLNIPDASASNRGVVTTGTQTFVGAKTFTNNLTASANMGVGGGSLYRLHVVGTTNTIGVGVTGATTSGDVLFYGSGTITGNGSLFNDDISASGAVLATLKNTNTSATGGTLLNIQVAGASGGNPYMQYTINGVRAWYQGVDNANGDAYTIGRNNDLSSPAISISTSDVVSLINTIKPATGSTTVTPLQFTSGTLNTTAVAGGVEFLTDKYYATITTGAARKEIALTEGLTSGRIPFSTTNGRLVDNSTLLFDGDIITTGGLKITNGSSSAGALYKSATIGLGIRGITGSSSDFTLFNPGGSSVISNPTGTRDLTFDGGINITNAPTTSAGAYDILTRNSSTGVVEKKALGTDPYTAITTTYTALSTDFFIDATTGTFTLTLPTAVGISGRTYVIKNSGAGTVTIDANSTETIDGALTKVLNVQYAGYRITSDGANWKVTGAF